MSDLAGLDSFDLDRIAERLGAPPAAPLAVPTQLLERPRGWAKAALLRLLCGRAPRVAAGR